MQKAIPAFLAVLFSTVFGTVHAQWQWMGLGTAYSLVITDTAQYAATYWGVYKSDAAGQNWQPANTGIVNKPVTALAATQAQLFAADDSNIYTSVNGGANWQHIHTIVPAGPAQEYSRLYASPATLFVQAFDYWGVGAIYKHREPDTTYTGTGNFKEYVNAGPYSYFAGPNKMFISYTDGDTISILPTTGLRPNAFIECIAATPDYVYLLSPPVNNIIKHTFYRSNNQGQTWDSVSATQFYLRAMVAHENYLFGYAGMNINYSADTGHTWQTLDKLPAMQTIYSLQVSNGYLYACCDGGVYRYALNAITGVAQAPVADAPLTIYPNPAAGTVYVNTPAGLTGKAYHVYSLAGRLLLTGTLMPGRTGIDLQGLAAGTYILSANGQSVQVVKQ